MYLDYTNSETIITDVGAINNSIKNIILTQKGSLPGKPRFGSDMHKVIFNQLDHITKDILKRSILDAINEFEPRIMVNDVIINEIPEYNKLTATIKYEYSDKGLILDSQTSLTIS